LAKESGKTAKEVLKMQEPFLKTLEFGTEWARTKFHPWAIEAKIRECRRYLDILERGNPAYK
jgi:hypothetical protein